MINTAPENKTQEIQKLINPNAINLYHWRETSTQRLSEKEHNHMHCTHTGPQKMLKLLYRSKDNSEPIIIINTNRQKKTRYCRWKAQLWKTALPILLLILKNLKHTIIIIITGYLYPAHMRQCPSRDGDCLMSERLS